MTDLHNIRRDYQRGRLSRADLLADPFQQFELWMRQALAEKLNSDPTAMTVATASKDGIPSQRVVLLKSYDHNGFVFYTNQHSRKGKEIAENPRTSLHFAWLTMERQVAIDGVASALSRERVEQYFHARPKASQVAALASSQSQAIDSRATLEQRYQQLLEQYAEQQVPVPEQWGGYLVTPNRFEFWQGGEHRLHDRFSYQLAADKHWHITRLQP
ncbi:pyridoxamine 5'-phosphate oxidase [Idiomarina tyrosinivorans]|uniref:Pyridoxine/pyridoxamine 5'-phosphate oxidase n=1 Tax=Idiomarina tyrosinivorans TaxID=1445662 RepID=A0A432ZSP9_9GAMM|nr:pyridoxamine 5'-phosphate oxidase [Idiomarina tyrosinivorans]RUO80871.1 pyridoxamine 5'-phosphate oxidase [Idiomarina tyrosinivorans]